MLNALIIEELARAIQQDREADIARGLRLQDLDPNGYSAAQRGDPIGAKAVALFGAIVSWLQSI